MSETHLVLFVKKRKKHIIFGLLELETCRKRKFWEININCMNLREAILIFQHSLKIC